MIYDINNKRLHLIDRGRPKDKAFITKTDVQIFVPGTDECVFRSSNKVILPGSIFTAAKHFNITPDVRTPSYNEALSLENTVNEDPGFAGIRREECVVLFAVGTGGCGPEGDQVYDVDYKKWITPDEIVPFRYPLAIDDISYDSRSTYFGRKAIGERIAYYFKAFDTTPELVMQYKDGTPITESIYESSKSDEVEVYVELRFKVTKEDTREFFDQTVGINKAVVNTISLLTAWPTTVDGYVYYQDVRPLPKINIPNEYLSDLSKGMDIVYHIYY